MQPPKHLIAARAFWNIWKIILPGALVEMVIWVALDVSIFALMALSIASIAILLPALVLAASIALLALPVIAKWLLLWRYKPGRRVLWSAWMWRYEVAYEIELLILDNVFAPILSGTPYLAMFYRAMGARIGRRACLIEGVLMECDLIKIGKDVTIEGFLQTHLFEDRVMELGRIEIHDSCYVGKESCVLFDSSMLSNSSLGDLSLIMKNETFPEGRSYLGLPAKEVSLASSKVITG